ncbi:MAG: DnaJ domain-containing protein [Pseudomonadota bacterium]|nr:DnaJ domain-containing protein [Pseudomonadota bacterium]
MIGFLALLCAVGAAGWLLFRAGRGARAGGEGRNVTILKGVVFLGLAAALFAAKLWPLAFMVLVAAGGITAIEMWRERAIKADEAGTRMAPAPRAQMGADEAASVLGVAVDADAGTIRAAHKKLISQLHPDKGGTDYLAAKINEARDVLAKRNAGSGKG